jgi:UDP-glucose 4-epimerase
MRALVTGAAGFIGSTLADRLLVDGWDVAGVDSFSDYYPRWMKERNVSEALRSGSYRLVEADLASDELAPLLDGVDVVFHLAAQAGVRSSWGQSFGAYLYDNELGTQRLLEASRASSIRKLVYASSSSIYGDAESYPTPETAVLKPISPYGVTKLAAENLCWLYWRRFGVPAVSLRLFTVYGPRQRPDMAFHIFGRSLIEGRPIRVFGDGEQSREFTYVDDVVAGMVAASQQGREGEVYNLGGGSEATVNEAIGMLESIGGRKASVEYAENQAGDARRTAADITKARADLGFQPGTSLRDGLGREYAWLEELLRMPARK